MIIKALNFFFFLKLFHNTQKSSKLDDLDLVHF